MNPSRLIRVLLIITIIITASEPVFAQIVTKGRRRPSDTWSPKMRLTFGGGVEFQTDSEQTQYDFPLLVEYNFTKFFKATIEPNFVYIESKSKNVSTVGGIGDLETSAEYEFLRERRYRPAFTALSVIKLPTAGNPDLGDPGTDYSVGLIFSKDLVFLDVDLNVLYTFVGDPQMQNTTEISLGAEYPIRHFLDLEAEILASNSGAIRGQPGTVAGLGGPLGGGDLTEIESTIGIAEHITKRLKLEQGFVYLNDHSWQIIFAWEWSGSGD